MATWTAIWRGLNKDERIQAVRAFLDGPPRVGDDATLAVLFESVAQTRSFRTATVAKMPADKIAGWVAAGNEPPARLIATLVAKWHLKHRVEVLSAFLDRLGIRHARGSIDETERPVAPSAELLSEAIRHLATRVPERDVTRYLDCLELQGGAGIWANLASARKNSGGEAAPAEEGAGGDRTGPKEQTPGFSTLDRMLIDAAVGAAQGADGALDRDELRDLVDEVVSLSSRRQRSYFHKGFFEALMSDEQPAFGDPEMNDERRAWQLSGFIVGCARRQRQSDLLRALEGNRETVVQLASGGREASWMAVPLIFDHVAVKDGLSVAARLLKPAAVVAAGTAFASRVLDGAVKLMRVGRVEEAAPALELMDWAIRGDVDEAISSEVRREHLRRMGQLQRRRGDFGRATAIFQKLLSAELPEWMRRRTLADLGLCRARCRGLEDVRLPTDRGGRAAAARALADGEAEFQAAAGAPIRTGGHGEYCLGVLRLLQGKQSEARPLFERAVAEMSAEPAVYQPSGVLPRARLYLVVCGASSSPGATDADGHLRGAMAAIPDEMKALLGEVLIELAVVDSVRAAAFASEAFASFGEAVLVAAEEADLLPKLAPLRDALLERARTEGRPAADRFEDAKKALIASREANDLDRAREAFDVLEELAGRTAAERRKFLDLAGDVDQWESVWEPHEARFSLVPLLIQEGRSIDAGNVLLAAARDLVARRDEGSLELARDAVEQATDWLGAEAPPDLTRAVATKMTPAGPVRRPYGRVLFVGGNETQQQYDAFLREHVKSHWPEVTLEPLYTGWSSNWGRQVPQIETRLQAAGAVVIMKFVRTLLGHRIRALCSQYGKPWVPCTGHGRDSMVRSIERAVGVLPSRG